MILKFTRNRYQEGSLRRVRRKSGAEMWEYRYRNHAEPGSPMRQITLSILEYPTESKARIRLQEEVLRINGPESIPRPCQTNPGSCHREIQNRGAL